MIARKHIIAAIEAAPRELEFKRYYIRATYYRNSKSGIKGSFIISEIVFAFLK